MPSIPQVSMASGEINPSLHARVDLALYLTGLKTCRNFIVRPFGGVTNRPGLQYLGTCPDPAKKNILVPFDNYVLEFGHLYVYIWKNGARIMNGENAVALVTPWSESVLSSLTFCQSFDVMTITYQGTRPQQLSRFSDTSWTLTPLVNVDGPFMDLNIDTTKTIKVSAVSGYIALTASSDTIFGPADVGRLMYLEQLPDYSTPAWEPDKPVTAGTIFRAGANYYQAMTTGTTGTMRPSIIEGMEQDGFPGIKWRYLHSGHGVVKLEVFNPGGPGVDESFNGTVLKRLPDTLLSSSLSALTITNVYAEPIGIGSLGTLVVVIAAHGLASGQVVTISGVVGPTAANGTHTITVKDSDSFYVGVVESGTAAYVSGGTIGAGSISPHPTYKWAKEAWGAEQGFPQCSTYYQQRQIFGGRPGRPHQVNMSNNGAFLDFGQSVPLLDDEGINFDLVGNKKHEIRHFIVMRDLVALTSEGPWSIQKEQGNPIPFCTPQGKGGVSFVPPLEVESRALYVPRKGNTVRSIGYNFEQDGYDAKDLTLRAAHLFFGKQIVSWCYQEIPFNCVWVVLSDGALVGMTYIPEQEVIGWHRHDTDGLFESVCCVIENNEDAVYAVVRRYINGSWTRYIERMANRFFADIEDAFFVDSGLSFNGAVTTAWTFDDDHSTGWTTQDTQRFVAGGFVGASDVGDEIVIIHEGQELRLRIIEYISSAAVTVAPSQDIPLALRTGVHIGFAFARDTFAGLGHLEGKTVAILADGNVYPQQVVTSGTVTISPPASVVHVGLPITADIETLDLNAQGQSLQDKVKNVSGVAVQMERTRGLQAGPDASHLLEMPIAMSGGYAQPVGEVTGTVTANILSDWSLGGRVFIRQSEPLPATILAVIPEVAVGGR